MRKRCILLVLAGVLLSSCSDSVTESDQLNSTPPAEAVPPVEVAVSEVAENEVDPKDVLSVHDVGQEGQWGGFSLVNSSSSPIAATSLVIELLSGEEVVDIASLSEGGHVVLLRPGHTYFAFRVVPGTTVDNARLRWADVEVRSADQLERLDVQIQAELDRGANETLTVSGVASYQGETGDARSAILVHLVMTSETRGIVSGQFHVIEITGSKGEVGFEVTLDLQDDDPALLVEATAYAIDLSRRRAL